MRIKDWSVSNLKGKERRLDAKWLGYRQRPSIHNKQNGRCTDVRHLDDTAAPQTTKGRTNLTHVEMGQNYIHCL
jgi:hypothetical protein